MVYYIRFLKPPIWVKKRKAKGMQYYIQSLITITNDLGDQFMADDLGVTLCFTCVTHPQLQIKAQQLDEWGPTDRQVPIEMGPFSASMVGDGQFNFKAQALDISKDRLKTGEAPLVVAAFSAPFSKKEPAEKLVERQFYVGDEPNERFKIWEETGNSIARHLWDAALASIMFLHDVTKGIDVGMPALNQLLTSPRSGPLQIVELGSGCGMVGIGLTTMVENCNVLLTDMPEAEEIITRNVNQSKPKANSGARYQSLDWNEPPAELCNQALDLILVSDCTYNSDSQPALVSCMQALVRSSPEALVLVALKRRHESEAVFFDLMQSAGFEGMHAKVALPAQNAQTDEIEMYCYRRAQEAL
ncbi:hypothetical protein N7532_009379 [Penicillium argentinense]|uniref:Methyltransferase-domain-containing protein n=1 Tax=Penicillium argentinense TaxID=1131581 RepID=A0A9W9EZA6_9EURO|nr:uncharacterized protein N7532_009379 [Penicillium argentinense]KAJ5090695.1 hypothetical protein N7532_009379 [Penicillium argentinense]